MGEHMLLIGTVALVATITSVVLTLQLQKRHYTMFSTRRVEWEKVQKRSQYIWETLQEKRPIELEHSLTTYIQHVEKAWKEWEAKDSAQIASTAQCYETTLGQIRVEQELARLPKTDEIPLKEPF
ncbi:MAG: hypothetical protein NVS4B12_05530 [Ktedonobacteraceae bacterium]